MRRASPYSLLVSTVALLSVLFGGGVPGIARMWPDLSGDQERPRPLPDPQTHALMDQISGAFETAATKVSAFAIPINMARSVMDQLLTKGRVIRGYLGLTAQDIDDSLVKPLKLMDSKGALVSEVVPDSPADHARIKAGDVIIEFNGKKVEDSSDIHNYAAGTAPGTEVKIVLLRDGQRVETTAVLLERPAEKGQKTPRPEEPKGPTSQKLGLSIQTLTPDIAQQLGYGNDSGVVGADVASGSLAEDAGLQRGDLIKEVDRLPVRTTQDFEGPSAASRAVTRPPCSSAAATRRSSGP